MGKENIQRFELSELLLQYDFQTCNLLCRSLDEGKNLWIKKIEDGGFILDVNEDGSSIFISVESDSKSGQFLVLSKKDGTTNWFIPGKACMFRIFLNYVYLIFTDAEDNFYLIKTAAENGAKLWHHAVNDMLSGYTINEATVLLKYIDGSIEILSSSTGLPLK